MGGAAGVSAGYLGHPAVEAGVRLRPPGHPTGHQHRTVRGADPTRLGKEWIALMNRWGRQLEYVTSPASAFGRRACDPECP